MVVKNGNFIISNQFLMASATTTWPPHIMWPGQSAAYPFFDTCQALMLLCFKVIDKKNLIFQTKLIWFDCLKVASLKQGKY